MDNLSQDKLKELESKCIQEEDKENGLWIILVKIN